MQTNLHQYVIYRCVVGSRAYGLDETGSDTDRRGIYLPPADLHWSLNGVPGQLEDTADDEVYWEIEKFLKLALRGNPTILECLYTPMVQHATPLAMELREMRDSFLSKLIYQTYGGYVNSQFKKLQADLQNNGEIKWKHAMHLLRLLLAGITALREGTIVIHAGQHRDKLLAVRRGEFPLMELERWRIELQGEFDQALALTPLPDVPDHTKVNQFLLKARRSAL